MHATGESDLQAGGADYRALARAVRDAGLFRRRRGYYTAKITANLLLLVLAVAAVYWLGNSWWQLVVAGFMAFIFAQLAFVGHDAGHRQICRTPLGNDMVGLVHANLLTGFSYGWWLAKHNRHHAHCNREGKDPDIGPGVVAFTSEQATRRRGVAGLLARGQAVLFLPLLLLEALNLHVASLRALRQRRGPGALVEAALLLAHMLLYVAMVTTAMSAVHAALFVVVNQGMFGLYLGLTFAPNHTGMPVLQDADELSFLRRQIVTSRNIRGRSLTGFVFGGLDLQIEHHLFPTMPRANLRRAQGLVRPFCHRHSIGYCERTLRGAYADVLSYLHHVAKPGPVML